MWQRGKGRSKKVELGSIGGGEETNIRVGGLATEGGKKGEVSSEVMLKGDNEHG